MGATLPGLLSSDKPTNTVKGGNLVVSGHYQEGLAILDQSINKNKKNKLAYFFKGYALMMLNEDIQAIENLNKAIEIDPKYALAYSNKAAVLIKIGRFEEAMKNCDTAIKLDSKLSFPYLNKGEIYRKLNNIENALHYYSLSIKYNPRCLITKNCQGLALLQRRKYQEAFNYFNEAYKLNPNFQVAVHNIGFTYEKLKDYQKAIEFYEKSINIRKDFILSHQRLSLTLIAISQLGVAQKQIDICFQLNSNHYKNHICQGELYRAQNRLDEAISEFQKSLSITQQFEGYWYLAIVYKQQKQYKLSLEMIEGGIKLTPTPEFFELKAEILDLMGESDEAKAARQDSLSSKCWTPTPDEENQVNVVKKQMNQL